MKQLFYLLLATTAFTAYSQTPLIAHKSHSGTSSSYFIDPSSNFGEVYVPKERLVQVIRLNDTISIGVYDDYYSGDYRFDTIYKNPVYANYNLNIDSLNKVNYYYRVEYLNFKASPDSLQPKKIKVQENQPEEEKINLKEESSSKKKKKGDLLLLSLLVGGGLFGFILLYKRLIYRTAV